MNHHIFNVASPYGISVIGKYSVEIGFQFVEGDTFFHLFPDGTGGEDTPFSTDVVANQLRKYIDPELIKIITG
ncbi:hypothetical protein L2106_24410 [Citrobacter portucalensis]|uniref:Uncharacterized protein n=1 Tax=Citrobacter portucalensis TaxID=1639133 RepID=A0ABZ0H436_9ENTR|nr:hypothetical protein [Citrobacter portucalensis]MDE9576530.1 hypothetical protein [Citrobacter portucalensis]MDE9649955.1 hypothetical protein [Citrobacter portucalensis]MEB2744159.1 hypothetical protein [Citrobacter portucalensis]WOH44673.1 hypothetical protein RY846_05680 [Citrobacter portucalensis]